MAKFKEPYIDLLSDILQNIENLETSLEEMQFAMILAGETPGQSEHLNLRQAIERRVSELREQRGFESSEKLEINGLNPRISDIKFLGEQLGVTLSEFFSTGTF